MKDPHALEEATFEPMRTKARYHKPAAKQHVPFPKCIKGKNCYSRKMALRKRAEQLTDHTASFLAIYKCPKCGYWHLTSKPQYKK